MQLPAQDNSQYRMHVKAQSAQLFAATPPLPPATQVIALAMEPAAQLRAHVSDFLQGDEPYQFDTGGRSRTMPIA